MAVRLLEIIVCVTLGALFATNVMGQARVGDWEIRFEDGKSEIKGRAALTSAHLYTGSDPKPTLVIRRLKSKSPVELLIISTHDKDKDTCEYKDWEISIDEIDIPVLGYNFEPAKTELKTKLGTPGEELWSLFKKGLKLVVQAEQKCSSHSGKSILLSHTFSLRGSSAAYMFVLGDVE